MAKFSQNDSKSSNSPILLHGGAFLLKSFIEEKGSIYLEILIATIILATITTGIMAMYQQSTLNTKKTNHITVATDLAKGTIETLKQFEGNVRGSANWTNGYPKTVTQNNVNYTINVNQVNSNQLPTSPIDIKNNNEIVPLSVSVSWNQVQNGVNKAKSINLATYFMQ